VRPGPRRTLGAWLASGRLVSLVLLIGTLGYMLYIFRAPSFIVRDVRVEGAQALSQRAIVELADAHDRSIWLVDTGQIADRLKTNAYVEEASAILTLPDRLTIRVKERQPELRWRASGTLYLVDRNGRVLDTDATLPLTNTLVIEDRSGQALKPNDQLDVDALELGRLLMLRLPAEIGLAPASIGWDTGTGVFVTTPDGRMIVFGHNDDLDNKLTVLGTLVKDGTAFTYLDLRPRTPFYRNDAASTPAPGEPTPEP
jgi:cell division protein FtsQ